MLNQLPLKLHYVCHLEVTLDYQPCYFYLEIVSGLGVKARDLEEKLGPHAHLCFSYSILISVKSWNIRLRVTYPLLLS